MMSYGDPESRDWVLDEAAAEPFVRKRGRGRGSTSSTLRTCTPSASARRSPARCCAGVRRPARTTCSPPRCYCPMGPGPNDGGLSRKHILAGIDASLRRLGVDYVDLYQIHRWDPDTPIEETMEALHDVVRAGKARYIGASSMFAWQFAKAQHVADTTPFVSMQNHYNLVYREEEREMIPLLPRPGRRGHPVEPARPRFPGRQPHSGRPAAHATGGQRPVRRRAVHATRTSTWWTSSSTVAAGARAAAGAGRAGLAAAQARRDRADRRRHQAGPARRRGRRGRRDLLRRRDQAARAAVPAPPDPRPRIRQRTRCPNRNHHAPGRRLLPVGAQRPRNEVAESTRADGGPRAPGHARAERAPGGYVSPPVSPTGAAVTSSMAYLRAASAGHLGRHARRAARAGAAWPPRSSRRRRGSGGAARAGCPTGRSRRCPARCSRPAPSGRSGPARPA